MRQEAVDLSSDVTLETSHRFFLGQTLFGPSIDVFGGAWVIDHARDHDVPQGRVGLTIAAAVFALLTWAVTKSLPAAVASAATPAVTVQSIGVALMSSYVLPLEIVALVLTVALIGAVIVAMPETRAPKSGNAQGGGK